MSHFQTLSSSISPEFLFQRKWALSTAASHQEKYRSTKSALLGKLLWSQIQKVGPNLEKPPSSLLPKALPFSMSKKRRRSWPGSLCFDDALRFSHKSPLCCDGAIRLSHKSQPHGAPLSLEKKLSSVWITTTAIIIITNNNKTIFLMPTSCLCQTWAQHTCCKEEAHFQTACPQTAQYRVAGGKWRKEQ